MEAPLNCPNIRWNKIFFVSKSLEVTAVVTVKVACSVEVFLSVWNVTGAQMISAQVRDIILLKLLPVKYSTISNWIQKQKEMFNPPCLLIEEKWRTGTHLKVEKGYYSLNFHSLRKPTGLIWVSFNWISTVESVVISSIWHTERLSCHSYFSPGHPLFPLLRELSQSASFLQVGWLCFYFLSWISSCSLSNFTWRSWTNRDKGYLTLQDIFLIQKVQIWA